MDKKNLILDALLQLLREGRAGTASVSDIARQARIAKGGMYYYFRSKEEVLDALVEREYAAIIDNCRAVLEQAQGSVPDKLGLLFATYRGSMVDSALDASLHAPENALIHQKSLAFIVLRLGELLADILSQGAQAGEIICEHPQQAAQIFLSVFAFLFDPGIFNGPEREAANGQKYRMLAILMERGLGLPAGSLSFLSARPERL